MLKKIRYYSRYPLGEVKQMVAYIVPNCGTVRMYIYVVCARNSETTVGGKNNLNDIT